MRLRLVAIPLLISIAVTPSNGSLGRPSQEPKQADQSCDGIVRELPADLAGRAYRSQCYRGVEIVAWADVVPARFGKKAQNAIFIIAVNEATEPVSVSREDFAIVSLDPKHQDNPSRASVALALNPVNVAEEAAQLFQPSASAPPVSELQWRIYNQKGQYVGQVVTENPLLPLLRAIQEEQDRQFAQQSLQNISAIVGWITQTSFAGGVISPSGHLYGIIYFPQVKGVKPVLMYFPKEWNGAEIKLPLGNWINSAQQ